jgi:ribonuclease P protein component
MVPTTRVAILGWIPTAGRRSSGWRPKAETRHEQAHVPAEQSPSEEEARLPNPDADPQRPATARQAAGEGAREDLSLIGLAAGGAWMRPLFGEITMRPSMTSAGPGKPSKPDVARVMGAGRRLAGRRMVVYVAPGEGTRAAFVCGRRIGGSVVRNRARRIMREAWKSFAPRVRPGHDVVFAAREGIRGVGTRVLIQEMSELLAGIGVMEEPAR